MKIVKSIPTAIVTLLLSASAIAQAPSSPIVSQTGLTATAAAPASQVPVIVFDHARVLLTVDPGDTVVVFGAAQRTGGTRQLMRWQRVAADEDEDGLIELVLPQPVEPNSVWLAVNVETGAVGTAAPPASTFRRIDFPAGVLPKDAAGGLDRYITGRGAVDLLVVRPHVGAWSGLAADGREGDADGKYNGGLTLKFSNLRTIHGNSPAPHRLTPHDVVVAVDVRRLEYYATDVNP
jgi:hypothetical protein